MNKRLYRNRPQEIPQQWADDGFWDRKSGIFLEISEY